MFKSFWNNLFNRIKAKDIPDMGFKIADIAEYEANEQLLKKAQAKRSTGLTLIPVAIHVMHKGEEIGTGSNISDAQIYSGITAMNNHFSKALLTEGDGSGVDTGIRFMLENKYVNGIYRVNGAALSSEFANNGVGSDGNELGVSDSVMKGWSYLPNQEVCNIWIVPEINGNKGGSGVQGYAYYPTVNIVDGMVCIFNTFGTVGNLKSYTNQSKTPTHELGHYFSLPHTFSGSSCVPNLPKYYMSYGTQNLRNTFEQCESDRMDLVLGASRINLSNSDAADNLSQIVADLTYEITSPKSIVPPNSDQYISVKITNTSEVPIHKIEFGYFTDDLIGKHDWYGAIPPLGTHTITIDRIKAIESDTIHVTVNSVNGATKDYDFETSEMIVPTNEPYKVELIRDNLSGQISWAVANAVTSQVYYNSPVYPNFNAGILDEHYIYLPNGSYVFSAVDAQKGFATQGAYIRFISPNGTILVNQTQGFTLINYFFKIGIEGDINNDGKIDILDLSLISKHYGTKIGDELYNKIADLNNDGFINIKDISLWLQNFKTK